MIRAKPDAMTSTGSAGLFADDSVDQMSTVDVEKGSATPRTAELPATRVQRGRPDIQSHVAACAKSCTSTDRIGIGACGPDGLIKCTKEALAQSTYAGGPSMTLHTEVSDFIGSLQN